MDQKNIGQVSGVNDRERQDFSGLNSSSVEQVPDGMGQMTSGDFGAEQVPTGLTQDEAGDGSDGDAGADEWCARTGADERRTKSDANE